MTEEKQPNLDSWDDFAGEWIKGDLVTEEKPVFVVTGINAEIDDVHGKLRLIADVEYHGRKWKWDINRTNQAFIRSKKLTPKKIIGKKLTLGKTQARNPKTSQIVDSLLITNIE